MELIAVINSLEYVVNEKLQNRTIELYSDSQYVVNIPNRAQKLIHKDFKTNSGKQIQNADLVKHLIELLNQTKTKLIKVKAHQKASSVPNYNREVDKLSRKIVRNKIENPE
jgi:ribonuclease HI